MSLRVFVSYRGEDASAAAELDARLRSVGVTVIRDERSAAAYAEWSTFMEEAVAAADFVVALLSPGYLRSRSCLFEARAALDREGDPFVPVLAADPDAVVSPAAWSALEREWSGRAADAADGDALPVLARIRAFLDRRRIPTLDALRAAGYAALLERLGFAEADLQAQVLRIGAVESVEQQEVLLDEHLRAHPDHALAHQLRAGVQKQRGDLLRARRSYERAIEARPDYADAHNDLALLLEHHTDEHELSARHYRAAIDADPGFDLALNNYGSFLKSRGRHDEARALFERALGVNPAYAGAHSNLGTLLAEHYGELEAAGAAFRRAIALNERYAQAHFNYAVLLEDFLADPDAAAVHFARAEALRRELGDVDLGWERPGQR